MPPLWLHLMRFSSAALRCIVAALPPRDSWRSLTFIRLRSIDHPAKKKEGEGGKIPPLLCCTDTHRFAFSLGNAAEILIPRVVRSEASSRPLFVCFGDKQWPVDVILNRCYASRAAPCPPPPLKKESKMNKRGLIHSPKLINHSWMHYFTLVG